MRFLKALLTTGKSTKQDQDSFSKGLNRLARVQPDQIGQSVLFKARPRARAV
jgi:hypothetical protein